MKQKCLKCVKDFLKSSIQSSGFLNIVIKRRIVCVLRREGIWCMIKLPGFFYPHQMQTRYFFLFIVRSRTKAGVVFLDQVDCWCLFCLLQDFTDGCRWSISVLTKFPHTSSTQSKLWQRILFARVHLRERETETGGGKDRSREGSRASMAERCH